MFKVPPYAASSCLERLWREAHPDGPPATRWQNQHWERSEGRECTRPTALASINMIHTSLHDDNTPAILGAPQQPRVDAADARIGASGPCSTHPCLSAATMKRRLVPIRRSRFRSRLCDNSRDGLTDAAMSVMLFASEASREAPEIMFEREEMLDSEDDEDEDDGGGSRGGGGGGTQIGAMRRRRRSSESRGSRRWRLMRSRTGLSGRRSARTRTRMTDWSARKYSATRNRKTRRSNPSLRIPSDGAVTAAATGDDAKTSEVMPATDRAFNWLHRSQMALARASWRRWTRTLRRMWASPLLLRQMLRQQ